MAKTADKRADWRLVAVVILALSLLVVALTIFSSKSAHQKALNALDSRLQAQVHLRGGAFAQNIEQMRREVLFLASVPPVAGLVRAGVNDGFDAMEHTPEALWQQRLQHIFSSSISAFPNLTQVRLIGVANRGRELVRVDRVHDKAFIVSADQLQEKADRDYFLATLSLAAGAVHISDINLNREYGKVQTPHVPTLRASTPVFDDKGQLFGMVVLNFSAQTLFDSLQADLPPYFRIYLCNNQGDYLLHPDPGRTFGFDLDNRYRWQDEFTTVSTENGRMAPIADYKSASETLRVVASNIALDSDNPSRYLTIYLASSIQIVTDATESARRQVWLGLSVGILICGALFYLSWRNSRLQRIAEADKSRLSAIFESSNDAIIGETLDGTITDWNPAAAKMFGYTAQEAVGQTVLALIVPAELHAEERFILEQISQGITVPHFNTRRRHRNGSMVDVAVTVSPIYGRDGHIIGASKTVRDITSQVLAATALQEAQTRLLITTQANGIALWDWNVQDNELLWDDTMFALYGRRREDFGGAYDAWKASLHPDDVKSSEQAIADALAGRKAFDTSFRVITADNQVRHIRAKATVYADSHGKPLRMLGTNFDITQEKQREQRIEELNATLEQQVQLRTRQLESISVLQHAILANAAYAIIATDMDGKITLFNPAAELLLGYAATELVGKFTPEIIHIPAEVIARAKSLSIELGVSIAPGFEVFVAKAKRGLVDTNEWTYVTKDHATIPVLLTVSALRSNDEQNIGFLGIAIDLRERHQYEYALRENERFLHAIADNIPGMVGYWNVRLQCEFANKAYLEWFGKSPEEMHGINMRDVLGPELYSKNEPYIHAALRGEYQQFERTLTKADGTVGYTWAHYIPDLVDKRVRGFYVLVSDVSELKQAQLHLEALNETLALRTREAESATTAKSQFLANMSHEIRSPMNAILGMLQLLLRTEMTARQRDYAAKAHGATQSLVRLLNDILDFSKIEAGKIAVEHIPFSIDAMLRDISAIVSVNMGNKSIELSFAIDTKLPQRLLGDIFRLRQVLLNLTGNAIKFTEHGNVVLSIQLVKAGNAQAEVEFSVSDTGIGIAEDKRNYIFEGFSQAEASTTRRFGGTGLGLAISHRLVSLMGGDLKVESQLNVGSRFHFRLVLDCVAEAENNSAMNANAMSVETGSMERPLHVLIVDDNTIARETLLAMAQSMGWQSDCASNGLEALAMLSRQTELTSYDVIFLDWKMPELDGWQTAEQIRQLPGANHTPIIIMITAYSREALATSMHDNPDLLNGFLVKPVTASMLFDALLESSGEKITATARDRSQQGLLRLSGLHLLVVEDNLMNQQVALELLGNEGAIVELSSGGIDGVEKVCSTAMVFDAVLMDIQMPDIDGFEATRRIRQSTVGKTLPIIAMTANAMDIDIANCMESGMNDHVAKPIDLDILVDTLLRHCRSGLSGNSPTASTQAVSPNLEPEGAVEENEVLARLGGNKSLFRKIAQHFVADVPETAEKLRQRVADNDVSGLAKLLHTLKGTAGTVGLQQLANFSAEFELLLCNAPPDFNPAQKTQELIALLDKTSAVLSARVSEMNGQAVARQGVDSEPELNAVLTLLRELLTLLDDYNLRAIDVYAQIELLLDKADDPRHAQLGTAINALNFSRASELCQQLIEHIS